MTLASKRPQNKEPVEVKNYAFTSFCKMKKNPQKTATTATKHCVHFYQHLIFRWLAGFASALPFFLFFGPQLWPNLI